MKFHGRASSELGKPRTVEGLKRDRITFSEIAFINLIRLMFTRIASWNPSEKKSEICVRIADTVERKRETFERAMADQRHRQSLIDFIESFCENSSSEKAPLKLLGIALSNQDFIVQGLQSESPKERRTWRRIIHHVLHEYGSQKERDAVVHAMGRVLDQPVQTSVKFELVELMGWYVTHVRGVGEHERAKRDTAAQWDCIRLVSKHLSVLKDHVLESKNANDYRALSILLNFPERFEYLFGRATEVPVEQRWLPEDMSAFLTKHYTVFIPGFTSESQPEKFLDDYFPQFKKVFLSALDPSVAQLAKQHLKEYFVNQGIDFSHRLEVLLHMIPDDPFNLDKYTEEIILSLISSFGKGLRPDVILKAWRRVNPGKQEEGMRFFACIKKNFERMNEMEMRKKGMIEKLYKEFKIVHFGRYPLTLLERVLKDAQDPNKPYVLILNARYDWNGAMYREAIYSAVEKAVKASMAVRIFEYDQPTSIKRIFQMMKLRCPKKKLIPFGIFGGHSDGSTISTSLWKKFGETHLKELGEWGVKDFFSPSAVLILSSCSTGNEVGGMARDVSTVFGIDTIGPTAPASLEKVELSEDGSLNALEYRGENERVVPWVWYRNGEVYSRTDRRDLTKLPQSP